MCLSPIKIRVNNAYLSQGHLQPMYIYAPCGHCAECMQLKRDQFYLRNYWHAKECMDKGGYCYFETLTYRDDCLPRLSWWFPEFEGTSYDYSCFCYEHYRNFMKRLRTNLSRGVFEPDYLEVQKLRNEKKKLKDMKSKYPLRSKQNKLDNQAKRDWIDSRIEQIDYEINDLVPYLTKWPAAENLNAFCVTEYGDDGIYRDDKGKIRKATFRPHYHLLFYVNIPDLPSTKLGEYIYKSWKKGKTDSVDVDGNLRTYHIRNHNTIGKNYSRNADIDLRKVSKYVAKYITKDAWYSEKLNQRVQYAAERLIKDVEEYDACYTSAVGELKVGDTFDYFHCYRLVDNQKKINQLKRLVDGFHLQGLGFGLYALDPENLDMDEIMEKGTMSMPDSVKIVKHIPVPQYYLRHLFYDVVTPNDDWRVNSPTYILNEKGRDYRKAALNRSYEKMCKKYNDLVLNFKELDKLKLNYLLDNRTIEDYVLYKCFYQNRFNYGVLNLDKDDAINRIVTSDNREGDIYIDKDHFVYTKTGRWTVEHGKYGPVYGPEYCAVKFEDYASENAINEFSHPYFLWFDEIDEIFKVYFDKIAVRKQEKFDHMEETKKRIKK